MSDITKEEFLAAIASMTNVLGTKFDDGINTLNRSFIERTNTESGGSNTAFGVSNSRDIGEVFDAVETRIQKQGEKDKKRTDSFEKLLKELTKSQRKKFQQDEEQFRQAMSERKVARELQSETNEVEKKRRLKEQGRSSSLIENFIRARTKSKVEGKGASSTILDTLGRTFMGNFQKTPVFKLFDTLSSRGAENARLVSDETERLMQSFERTDHALDNLGRRLEDIVNRNKPPPNDETPPPPPNDETPPPDRPPSKGPIATSIDCCELLKDVITNVGKDSAVRVVVVGTEMEQEEKKKEAREEKRNRNRDRRKEFRQKNRERIKRRKSRRGGGRGGRAGRAGGGLLRGGGAAMAGLGSILAPLAIIAGGVAAAGAGAAFLSRDQRKASREGSEAFKRREAASAAGIEDAVGIQTTKDGIKTGLGTDLKGQRDVSELNQIRLKNEIEALEFKQKNSADFFGDGLTDAEEEMMNVKKQQLRAERLKLNDLDRQIDQAEKQKVLDDEKAANEEKAKARAKEKEDLENQLNEGLKKKKSKEDEEDLKKEESTIGDDLKNEEREKAKRISDKAKEINEKRTQGSLNVEAASSTLEGIKERRESAGTTDSQFSRESEVQEKFLTDVLMNAGDDFDLSKANSVEDVMKAAKDGGFDVDAFKRKSIGTIKRGMLKDKQEHPGQALSSSERDRAFVEAPKEFDSTLNKTFAELKKNLMEAQEKAAEATINHANTSAAAAAGIVGNSGGAKTDKLVSPQVASQAGVLPTQ